MKVLHDAVALAIETLSWMEHEGLSERAAFARASRQLQVTRSDQLKTAQLLVLETTRRRNFIDQLIETAAGGQVDLDSLEHGLTSLLRMFCYWTKFHMAREDDAIRILNAGRSVLGWDTLRPIEHLFGRILAVDHFEATSGLPAERRTALHLFHPVWFVRASATLLGRPAALELMRRNLGHPSSYIRLNTLQAGEETCLSEIEKAGIRVKPVEELPLTYEVLSAKRPIVHTEPYRRGRIVVQDKGSILASLVAAPEPGDRVVDLCAAPGTKTTHIAQLMRNDGTIYSVDRSAVRMSFWKREVSRLGVEIAQPLLADATKPLPLAVEADVVVLDPPCSNTGTFWRSPAAKWSASPTRVRQLAETQLAMLENAAHLLGVGGALVYSTCILQ